MIYFALNFFNSRFAKDKNNEHIIYKGFKISSTGVIIIPVNNNNNINQSDNLSLEFQELGF